MNRDQLYRKAKAHRYSMAVEDARAIIAEGVQMAAGGLVAVGVSGGKDSVAMLHLVRQVCQPHVVFNDSGLETPEALPLVRDYAERLGCPLHIAHGDAIAIELAGGDTNNAIIRPVQKTLREIGAAIEFVGLRSCESRTRRIVIGKHGPLHRSARYGCIIGWPMRKWSAADVFAYIDEHGLPLHPAYSRDTQFFDRDDIRVSWAYDPAFANKGAINYTRRHYPELYRRLVDIGVISQ